MPVRRRTQLEPQPIGSGRRDMYVTIEQCVQGTDSGGFPVTEWSSLATVWMQRVDIAGDEFDRTGQRFATVTTRWEMPYRADMDPMLQDIAATRRLVHFGRRYNISAAVVLGRRRTIELMTLASSNPASPTAVAGTAMAEAEETET